MELPQRKLYNKVEMQVVEQSDVLEIESKALTEEAPPEDQFGEVI